MIEHETKTRAVQQFNYKEDFRLKYFMTYGYFSREGQTLIVILHELWFYNNISADATV